MSISRRVDSKFRPEEPGMDSPSIRFKRRDWLNPSLKFHVYETGIHQLSEKNDLYKICPEEYQKSNFPQAELLKEENTIYGKPAPYYNLELANPEMLDPVYI